MTQQRIPATVVTGFLGAGKTTLIRNIIQQAGGRRLALIVNEFGDIGMDADMLKDCGAENCTGDDIIELANGCICCTVADDFLPSMKQLLERDPRPDHIIIETSGLALPQPLVQAFSWPDIRQRVLLDGVVTLVDGPALAGGGIAHDSAALEAQREADEELDHESPIEELFQDQISAANLIVLSKADLLDEKAEGRARQAVMDRLDSPAPVISVSQESVPMEAILGIGMEEEAFARARHHHHHHYGHDHPDGAHDHSHDHPDADGHAHAHAHDHHHSHSHAHPHPHTHSHDEFASHVIEMGEVADADALCKTIEDMATGLGVLRAKGRVSVKGKALPFVVQAVGRRVDGYYARDADAATGRLVVIGLAGLDADAIAKRLGGKPLDGHAST